MRITLNVPSEDIAALEVGMLPYENRSDVLRKLIRAAVLALPKAAEAPKPTVCRQCKANKHEACFNRPFTGGKYADVPECNCQECPLGLGGRPAL